MIRRPRLLAGTLALALVACADRPSAPAASAAPAASPPVQKPVPPAPPPAPPIQPAQADDEALTPEQQAGLAPGWRDRQSRAPVLGEEELRKRFDPFPRALGPITMMGDEMVAMQVPMSIAFFETEASALEILQFYGHQFSARGWSWQGTRYTQKMVPQPAISATDPNDYLQMSVMVLPNGKDQPRTVILSIADVRPEARVPDEGDLPRYPGATPLTVRSREVGLLGYTQSFVTQDKARDVAAFYSLKMRELGYREGSEEGVGRASQVFEKQGRRWRLHITERSEGTAVTAISTSAEERAEEKP